MEYRLIITDADIAKVKAFIDQWRDDLLVREGIKYSLAAHGMRNMDRMRIPVRKGQSRGNGYCYARTLTSGQSASSRVSGTYSKYKQYSCE